MWTALGRARANGKDIQYPAGEKHAFLVMAQSDEKQIEKRVVALLSFNGWEDVAIERFKLLKHPFNSDDAVLSDCYNDTTQKGGAIIIYSDPISDS